MTGRGRSGGTGAGGRGAGWASAAGCAGSGASSRRCAPRLCCSSCSRSPACPALCCRRRASILRRSPSITRRIRRWRPFLQRCRCSTSSPRPGSRPSTCCSSPLSRAACCRAPFRLAARPGRPPAPRARPPAQAAGSAAVYNAGPGAADGSRRGRLLPATAASGCRTGDGWVSAEKGYLHEVGNLLFHVALLAPARLGGARRDLRLQGQPAAIVGPGLREHAGRARRLPPGPAGQPGDLQPFRITL